MRIINEFDVSSTIHQFWHVRTFWSLYLVQMGVGIQQSVADVGTDSLLSQNWPPNLSVRWRSCSRTEFCHHGKKRTEKKKEKNARNTTEFLIFVDLGKVWPPLHGPMQQVTFCSTLLVLPKTLQLLPPLLLSERPMGSSSLSTSY